MEDLFFERRPPAPWRFLHPIAWTLLLIFVPGIALGVAAGTGALGWVEDNLPGIPKSALIGTVVAGVILPAVAAALLPLLWRRRYGSCWLRGDVLTFGPGDLSFPRAEIKGWRRQGFGLVLDSALHPDNVFLRPLLIPVEGEDELARALRWLEGTQPQPEESPPEEPQPEENQPEEPQPEENQPEDPQSEGASGDAPATEEAGNPEPLFAIEGRDQVFSILGGLSLVFVLPLLGGVRFGWEAVSICFGLGGILSTVVSLIVYLCITRRTSRVLPTERALLIGRRRLPYEELREASVEGRTFAYRHQPETGRERRGWTIVPEARAAELRAVLEEKLPAEALGSGLPSWAHREPRRGLARVLVVLLYLSALGLLSLPQAVYGRALAPFGIYKEVHLRDDDGHVLTLLYSPGEERPRFCYFASEGVMGGIAGYEVTVPGLLGDPSYGLRLGGGGRQVNLAEGRIGDGAYHRSLEKSSTAALRFGDGDWRTTSEGLPPPLVELALKLDQEPKLESLPQALEPLLSTPDCPDLIRDFVVGRTSWRVHEVADPSGERLVAIVLQGRVRTLAVLPPEQPYAVEFAVVAGKTVFFRSLSHGAVAGRPPGMVPTLTKKEDSQVCWIGPQGWSRAPIGNIELDDLLQALSALRSQRSSARAALKRLLGSNCPEALGQD